MGVSAPPLPVVDSWWQVDTASVGITRLIEPHVAPLLRCNVWHVRGRDRDLVVDSGMGIVPLASAARHLFDRPVVAVATHAHYDHTGGLGEFPERVIHPAEAEVVSRDRPAPLLRAELGLPGDTFGGYEVDDVLVTASPAVGWQPSGHRQAAAAPTRLVDEGDVVDLGDRAFEVLHLPGHSPGSIGLWEAATGTLFSGDAVYDGALLDDLPGSDVEQYRATMERLIELPVDIVHGGHDEDFGRDRLIEICRGYLSGTAR